jgi:hypothetical protein
MTPPDDTPRPAPSAGDFQSRVQPWMLACFNAEIAADRLERADRFIEEALELVQSGGYSKDRAHALVEYVYGRPQGDINQEVGGVMVTLAAYCLAFGVDMHTEAERELARINHPEIIEKIRAKQAAKPKGSALPVATPPTPSADTRDAALEEAAKRCEEAIPVLTQYIDFHCQGDGPAKTHARIEAQGRAVQARLDAENIRALKSTPAPANGEPFKNQKLNDLLQQSIARYATLSPEEKAAHDYEQKRSFAKGMCPDSQNYEDWCKRIDETMPPRKAFSDTRRGG